MNVLILEKSFHIFHSIILYIVGIFQLTYKMVKFKAYFNVSLWFVYMKLFHIHWYRFINITCNLIKIFFQKKCKHENIHLQLSHLLLPNGFKEQVFDISITHMVTDIFSLVFSIWYSGIAIYPRDSEVEILPYFRCKLSESWRHPMCAYCIKKSWLHSHIAGSYVRKIQDGGRLVVCHHWRCWHSWDYWGWQWKCVFLMLV